MSKNQLLHIAYNETFYMYMCRRWVVPTTEIGVTTAELNLHRL